MKKTINIKRSFALLAMTLLFVAAAPALDPVGVWDYEVTTPDGDVTGEMTITKTDDGYAVVIESDMYGKMELEDVTMEENVMEASFELDGMLLDFEFEFDGDELEGVVYAGEDELSFTATKQK